MTEKTKQIAFRVSEQTRREFYSKLELHGLDVTGFMGGVVARYLTGKETTRKEEAASPVRQQQNASWHQMLDEIFESGDREAISAVQQNIMVFHRIAEPKKRRAGAEKTGT